MFTVSVFMIRSYCAFPWKRRACPALWPKSCTPTKSRPICFCTKSEWRRAYREINDMERTLTREGVLVLKFWMQIDKDEQERRFRERQENPEKQWKITEEDWRNREKWDQYETAVNEMLIRTSTASAPWIVVEGNDKYYARLKVLRTVVEAIEERIKTGGRRA